MRLFRFCLACSLAAVATFGAEVSFSLEEVTGRGFPPDLVMYEVTPAMAAAGTQLRLVDEAGEALPLSIVPAAEDAPPRLAFVTDLPPLATRTFTLRDDGAGAVPESAVGLRKDGTSLIVHNGLFGIRVPSERDVRFTDPTPAHVLPSPIEGFRSGEGEWLGSGRVLDDRLVARHVVSVTHTSPVFIEISYRLDYLDGGYYEARIRVVEQVPMARVREVFDAEALLDGPAWELEMTAGWQPNRYSSARTMGNGALNAGWTRGLDDLAKKELWYLVPDSAWGTPLSHLGLFRGGEKERAPADGVLAGWVPLNKGDWRRMNAVAAHVDGSQVRLRLPMAVRHASWLREVTSETSPFSMQEHEPGLPTTYGRRVWGLLLAAPPMETGSSARGEIDLFYQARLLYGVIGLDRYKDYTLAWEQGEPVVYPRVFQEPMALEKRQALLTLSPLPEPLKQHLREEYFTFGGDQVNAKKTVTSVVDGLRNLARNPFMSPTLGHHHLAHNYRLAAAAEDLLAWEGLDAERRHLVRQLLAVICYGFQEPDAYSYGGGSHSGNPNMNTARVASAPTFMALIPEHPMASRWHQHIAEYIEYKSATQMAPGGGYFEFGASYHMHGGARVSTSIPGLTALQPANLPEIYDYWRQDWHYYMNLLTPFDPIWQSRMIPGMANSAPGNTEHFLEAAGSLRPHDERFARELLWAWLANGANGAEQQKQINAYAAPLNLEPEEPTLGSVNFPGIGAVLRAHQGPRETYMLFRSGFNWSHWYIDQGHFVLYSRGVPIAPFQPFQYHNSSDPSFDMYNTLRFGSTENQFPHAWPDSNIIDYTFSDSVDYLWSSTGYPSWYVEPGKTEPFSGPSDAPVGQGAERPLTPELEQSPGPFTWDRQVIFMKGETADSPNYFVFHDTMDGEGELASWLYLNAQGDEARVTTEGNTMTVDTAWEIDVDYIFLSPEAPAPALHSENQKLSTHNSNLWSRREAIEEPGRWWMTPAGEPVSEVPRRTNHFLERRTFMRVSQPAGEGYHWIIWPRAEDEPGPEVEVLAEGVTKITHAEGTDYVFLFAEEGSFQMDDLRFEGKAGAIRLRDEAVTLAMTSGRGWIGWKGWQTTATAPFTATRTLAEIEAADPALPPPMVEGALPFSFEEEDGNRIYRLTGSTPSTVDTDGVHLHGTRVRVDQQADGATRVIATDATYTEVRTEEVAVRGIGPFDLTFTPEGIEGTVEGRRRTLVTSWPGELVRPMFELDGRRWYAGWADDHSFGKRFGGEVQYGFAFGVLDGEQRVRVREWTYPSLPTPPPLSQLSW